MGAMISRERQIIFADDCVNPSVFLDGRLIRFLE